MSLSSLCTLLSLALIILAPSNNLLPVVNFSQAVTTSPSPPVPGTIIHHNSRAHPAAGGPTLKDPDLVVEQIFTGLARPTSIAFLGPNDILVLEKDKGTVQRIVNGKMLPEPILDVNVANLNERGLLGIAVAKNEDGLTYVFLYYTESGGGKDGDDAGTPGVEPVGNRLYRYDLVNNALINPKLLLDLPASPPPQRATTEKSHNSGKVVIGPVDQNVYVGIGDVGGHRTQSENNANGLAADGTGGILRVTQDGDAVVPNSPLGDDIDPILNKYYAYGIRNTFGMDFDPITGKLWDTENGPKFGDEINLVEPGFNSGWTKIQGLAKDQLTGKAANPVTDLVNFGGRGVYRDPEFVSTIPFGPTALKFLDSDNLGKQYKNTMFIGDVDTGSIYNFKLNPQRTGLLFDADGPLADKVANTPDEIEQGGIIFGKGFGVITDIQVNPYDGNLYVLTFAGSIYRISSSSSDD